MKLMNFFVIFTNMYIFWLRLITDTVIKAIAIPKFKDGLRTGVIPGGCLCPYDDCK